MTVLTRRPSFGLQTAYFGKALPSQPAQASAPQASAIPSVQHFGHVDKVQFGNGLTRRVVMTGAAGVAALAIGMGASGCGGTSSAASNGSGSGTVATSTANPSTQGTSCKAITPDYAFAALNKASGISTSELKAKLSKLSPNGVYGLSLLGPLAKDAFNSPEVMKTVATVGNDKSAIETARVAIFNLVYLDAKSNGATHPLYAGNAASIDLATQQLLDGNTQAFEGKNDPSFFSAIKDRMQQKGSDKVPDNYTGPGGQYLSDANKQGLPKIIKSYQGGAFFSMYNPAVKAGKVDDVLSKMTNIKC
jgi:hypothetical protein